MVGPVGMLTGLSITVNLKNIDDTSSQDISIILIEEVEGGAPYLKLSKVFNFVSVLIIFTMSRNGVVFWHLYATFWRSI